MPAYAEGNSLDRKRATPRPPHSPDIVLAERFCARWRVAGIAAPPPAAPAYAAARPASFVLCHRLASKESLASLAVRYGCDTVQLKRLNNLLSDNALACRWGGGLVVRVQQQHQGTSCDVQAGQSRQECSMTVS